MRSTAILFDSVSFSGVGNVSGTSSDNLSVPQQRVVENDEIFISLNKFNRISYLKFRTFWYEKLVRVSYYVNPLVCLSLFRRVCSSEMTYACIHRNKLSNIFLPDSCSQYYFHDLLHNRFVHQAMFFPVRTLYIKPKR